MHGDNLAARVLRAHGLDLDTVRAGIDLDAVMAPRQGGLRLGGLPLRGPAGAAAPDPGLPPRPLEAEHRSAAGGFSCLSTLVGSRGLSRDQLRTAVLEELGQDR